MYDPSGELNVITITVWWLQKLGERLSDMKIFNLMKIMS